MGSNQSFSKPDENGQSTLSHNEPHMSLFTLNELAEYDLSISKKEQYKNQIKNIFLQFQTEYKSLYSERKLKNNISFESKSKSDSNEIKDIRKYTSILIIIGSSINIQTSEYFVGNYQKGFDDLSTALLIRHLFRYSFGIPHEQILVTSTQNSDFTKINFDAKLISNPNNIFTTVSDFNPTSDSEFCFQSTNIDDFMLNQDINLAQVNDKQYKFYMDENIIDIVKPFNLNIIKKELTTYNESNLFVFLLDHEHINGFNEISYQFIIERLLNINCKHFYLFNDSNHSGSIIKLFKISKKFTKIFPGIDNPTLESALFYFLTNIKKAYSSNEQILFNIYDKLDLIDEYDIDLAIKNNMKSKLKEIDNRMLSKLSEFVLNLGDEFQSIGCVPSQFVQFAEKATIFVSSYFNKKSFTLPGRKFSLSILKNPRIRIFGSIFSSIIIEAFLDKESLITLERFLDIICDKYSYYKREYIEYIKKQNKYIEGKTNNHELPNEEEIEEFFSPQDYKKTHFLTRNNNFPQLNKILQEEQYWNVDITEVNSKEYNDVHFSLFQSTKNYSIGLISQKQLSYYDIPNIKGNKYNIEAIYLLFHQYANKYQTSFCQRAKINIDKLHKIEKDNEKDNIRKNISVLIIVGSSVNNQKSEYFNGEYQKDAEDLDTALLIRHLFKYAFGIQQNQILIVSTQKSDFRNRRQYDQFIRENVKNEAESDFYYKCSNEDEFLLYQHINLAQVGNLQYKFYFDESLKNVVKPFDIDIIKVNLNTNENSDLFVFFLDHGYTGGFNSMPYQFIISYLLEIKCKNFYVFNDSCYSGSLIKLIKISQNFVNIFPDIKDQDLETKLFYFLMDLNKKSQSSIQSDIDAKFKTSMIDSKLKEYLKAKLADSSNILKIYNYLFDIDDSFRSIECVPSQFVQFAEKATIFVSSYFNKKSITLPGRKFNLSILKNPRIRIFGSIFSSIIIEAFLDKESLITLERFLDIICDKYSYYKREYIEYIKKQNKYIEGETNNHELPNEEEIEEFFSPQDYKKTHFLTRNNNFPQLNKILQEEKYWNVDITEVNSKEYNDVHFCNFKIYHPHSSNYNSKYGPTVESFYMDKFMKDFENAVHDLFKQYKVNKKFTIDTFSQSRKDLERESCPLYGKFIGLIREFIKSSNYGAIRLLKVPIAIYFNDNQEDLESDSKIFADAFKKIIPYWEGIDLQ